MLDVIFLCDTDVVVKCEECVKSNGIGYVKKKETQVEVLETCLLARCRLSNRA
jgi:hypothetical protein